jgi:hypothetical protein
VTARLTRRRVLALPAAALLGRPAALFAAAPSAEAAWHGAEWEHVAPEALGWDSSLVAQARDEARAAGAASWLVVQHGRVVDSWGEISRRLELHSIRKSLLSALIGIAVAE